MKCPFCKAEDTGVIDSRLSEDGGSVRRRRTCKSCNKRFTTYERVETKMPVVVKANGDRTAYDRSKIATGFHLALRKRKVGTEQIDAAINRIEDRLRGLGEREVSSRIIGEMVMSELKKLDHIAYIRFASVYEKFEEVDDFRQKALEVKRPGFKRARGRQSPVTPTPVPDKTS